MKVSLQNVKSTAGGIPRGTNLLLPCYERWKSNLPSIQKKTRNLIKKYKIISWLQNLVKHRTRRVLTLNSCTKDRYYIELF